MRSSFLLKSTNYQEKIDVGSLDKYTLDCGPEYYVMSCNKFNQNIVFESNSEKRVWDFKPWQRKKEISLHVRP